MKGRVRIGEVNIPLTIERRRRARSIRLRVRPEGALHVVAPVFLRRGVIDDFVRMQHVWIVEQLARARDAQAHPVLQHSRAAYEAHRHRAYEFVMSRIVVLNAQYQFSYQKISIRNQRSRWGSCSKKGNLSFNYKIALLPSHLADYIIVHELCHLAELNHAPQFWKLVARTVPEHKKLRQELRSIGRGA